MFVRVLDFSAKTGKARELLRTINDQIIPILRDQPGFVDEVTLQSPDDPSDLIAISFWKSRGDAENYNEDVFPRVSSLIGVFLDSTPRVRTFDVATSTAHNISTVKKAA